MSITSSICSPFAALGPRVQSSDELRFPGLRASLDGLERLRTDVVRELLHVLRDHRGRLDHEVDEHVGAERLAEDHLGADPTVRGRVGNERRVLHVLRADPEHDLLPLVPLSAGRDAEHLVRDRERVAAELAISDPFVAGERGLDQVHRGRADEPGDEQVRRVVVQELRRVDLLEHALA